MSRKTELFDVSRIEEGLTTDLIPEITNWIVFVLKELSEQPATVAVNGDYSSVIRFFIPTAPETRLHVEATIVTELIHPALEIGDSGEGSMVSHPDSIDFVEETGPIGSHELNVHARLNTAGLKSILVATGQEAEQVSQNDSQLLAWLCNVIDFLNSRLETVE